MRSTEDNRVIDIHMLMPGLWPAGERRTEARLSRSERLHNVMFL